MLPEVRAQFRVLNYAGFENQEKQSEVEESKSLTTESEEKGEPVLAEIIVTQVIKKTRQPTIQPNMNTKSSGMASHPIQLAKTFSKVNIKSGGMSTHPAYPRDQSSPQKL